MIGTLTLAGLITVLALGLRPSAPHATGRVDGPVVAVSNPGAPYPQALIEGHLTMVDDCLMLGDAVVYWPDGTAWDETSQSVVFGGDFTGTAQVDAQFAGGGGAMASDEDFLRDLGDAGDVLRGCLSSTGTDTLLLAYP